MKDLKDRVAWAIFKFKEKTKLSHPEIGEILGVDKNTIATYINKKGSLKGRVLERLISNQYFSFNSLWLMENRGEPFLGAREKYPEVCGPEGTRQEAIDKKSHIYNKEDAPGVNDKMVEYGAGVDEFGKAVAGLREIFDSQDPVLIPAIQANIHAFKISVRRERQVQQQTNKINALEKECDNLKTRLEAIENRLSAPPEGENTEKKAM